MAAQRERPVAPAPPDRASPDAAPLLLAVETATREVSAALLRGEALLDEEPVDPARGAAEGLLPAVAALLDRAGFPARALEAFAVSIGPGSFTGLRVGVATVKGLAFGAGDCTVAVPTLEALAWGALAALGPGAAAGAFVPVLDARRGEVYAAAFAADAAPPGALRPLLEEGVYSPEELARRLPEACVLVGDGVAVCGDAVRAGRQVRLLGPPQVAPRARHVGALGARRLAAGEGVDATALAPRYLRRAEAEVRRTGVRFE